MSEKRKPLDCITGSSIANTGEIPDMEPGNTKRRRGRPRKFPDTGGPLDLVPGETVGLLEMTAQGMSRPSGRSGGLSGASKEVCGMGAGRTRKATVQEVEEEAQKDESGLEQGKSQEQRKNAERKKVGRSVRELGLGKESERKKIESLPLPPVFEYLQSPYATHTGEARLPRKVGVSAGSGFTPGEIFRLFFDDNCLTSMADNTNAYAEQKREVLSKEKGYSFLRSWKPTNIAELKIFIALQIYIGIFKYPALHQYWESDIKHPPFHHMSLVRYQQIKRFFHLSPPDKEYGKENWFEKLEPLASSLRRKFRNFYFPATNLSYDEMMVSFEGRSIHIQKQPNKPIDHGYKIWALCDYGYTWTFLFYSGAVGNEISPMTLETKRFADISSNMASEIFRPSKKATEQKKPTLPQNMRFSPTYHAVCTLVFQLPFQSHRFNIFFDNLFTTIPLFRYLRLHGIGAAGTTRPGRPEFPEELEITKGMAKTILEWNHLSGVVVDDVCAVLWQDNSTVLLLTTIHDLRNMVLSNRRKPANTSTNARAARQPFGKEEHRKVLPIPEIIMDYNNHMGGVDIADQLRASYTTHRKCWRNWLSLWFWLLDITAVNSYLLYKNLYSEQSHDQVTFRRSIVDYLINEANQELHPFAQPRLPHHHSYVTSNSTLPPFHLRNPFTSCHKRILHSERTQCWYCRYKRINIPPDHQPFLNPSPPSSSLPPSTSPPLSSASFTQPPSDPFSTITSVPFFTRSFLSFGSSSASSSITPKPTPQPNRSHPFGLFQSLKPGSTHFTSPSVSKISNDNSSLRQTRLYDKDVSKTGIWCSGCNLPLCDKRGCFREFHLL